MKASLRFSDAGSIPAASTTALTIDDGPRGSAHVEVGQIGLVARRLMSGCKELSRLNE